MLAKTSLILTLIVSLLFGAQARPVPQPVPAKLPGCAAMHCVRGCCPDMTCCAPQEKDAPQPTPMQVPQRGSPDLAAIGLFPTLVLYALPPVEANVTAAQDAAIPHGLPPLTLSCIFRI